jgi:hypothetical protein
MPTAAAVWMKYARRQSSQLLVSWQPPDFAAEKEKIWEDLI